jgi:rhodanese-related sulfurtransferase
MVKIRVSQIFTRTADEAVAAKKELDAGASFADMVQKYSCCPSKKSGGDLGWMSEANLDGFLGLSVTESEKGKIIGPIHSQYGYHILNVTDIVRERDIAREGPFTPATSMTEARSIFPETGLLLFKSFKIGLPVLGYQPEETVESVAKAHGKTAQEVADYLNSEYLKKYIQGISPEDLRQRLRSGNVANLAILDIREQWECDIARIDESLRVSPENCESILASLDKNTEIVLVDWKGERCASFRNWLFRRGFTHVKTLRGGIDAWSERIDKSLARYEIDEDDGYRYEDILAENH